MRAACSSSSLRSRSPLGSITTAPWPAAIRRPAIHAWVTVLPEPVAPTTSAWRPLVVPARMRTVRPRSSRPAGAVVPAPAAGAGGVEQGAPAARDLGVVAADLEVVAMPARAGHRGEHRGRGRKARGLLVER